MSSHRDIVRSLKQKDKKKEGEIEQIDDEDSSSNSRSEEVAVTKTPKLTAGSKKVDMIAADFLKQRIDEIRNNSRPKPVVVVKKPVVKPRDDDFELEIFDGESKTVRKLMDLTNGDDGLASLNGTKRKRDQSEDDEAAKRMRTTQQNDE